jgi:hypothetical protein
MPRARSSRRSRRQRAIRLRLSGPPRAGRYCRSASSTTSLIVLPVWRASARAKWAASAFRMCTWSFMSTCVPSSGFGRNPYRNRLRCVCPGCGAARARAGAIVSTNEFRRRARGAPPAVARAMAGVFSRPPKRQRRRALIRDRPKLKTKFNPLGGPASAAQRGPDCVLDRNHLGRAALRAGHALSNAYAKAGIAPRP